MKPNNLEAEIRNIDKWDPPNEIGVNYVLHVCSVKPEDREPVLNNESVKKKIVRIFRTQAPMCMNAIKGQAMSSAARYAKKHPELDIYVCAYKKDRKRRSSYF